MVIDLGFAWTTPFVSARRPVARAEVFGTVLGDRVVAAGKASRRRR